MSAGLTKMSSGNNKSTSTVVAESPVKRNPHANDLYRATAAKNETGAATRHLNVCGGVGDSSPTKAGNFAYGQVFLKFWFAVCLSVELYRALLIFK